MQPPLLAPPLRSSLDARAPEFQENRDAMLEKLDEIEKLLDAAELGGGTQHHERLAQRGKLPVRERIALALDPDSPFLEISSLAAYNSDYTIGGGAICGIGVIAGVECVIFANDPTVLGGALTPYVGKKWMRALEIARDNRIPYVSFVESAGADLRRRGSSKKDGKERAAGGTRIEHFAETGRFFYEMIELSKLDIPTVCVVFGSSTAGGAYQPGMSDYNVVIKEQSKIFLAGPPLVKMATGEESDDETLGGAKMHAEVSGLGEYLAEDEPDALRYCREIISHLNWRKAGPEPSLRDDPPTLDPEELLAIMDPELRRPAEIRDVIGRVVDGSRFEEFKPRYGPTLVCGFASIHGYPVGILGNNGVLYPESAEKGAHFVQICNQIDVPLVFLQNLTGFIVGRDFEAAGMIKKGSQLINAVTNSTVPHLTVIVGASYGAGTYAMSGRAFNNRFTFIWPSAKIAVMGGKQIAGVMSIVRRGQAARKGEPFDEEADAQIRAAVEAAQERGSVALEASGAISDDGIIDPRDTRTVLGICLSVVRNRPIEGADGYGVFRLVSFTTLLVANRGEIARRVIRSAHEMGIRCVAVYVEADADAPFVHDADEAVRLESSYLDAAAVLEAARLTGAGAVHPGYGFLSENAKFAADVDAAGIAWVGPSPDAIEQMGDKIAAKALAEKVKVPTLPGSEDPADADALGYPLLVKAAAGGGGKGMRIVASAAELEEALAAAQREALGGFGDERVFLERYVARARHIEIQILGDAHGNVVHLGERECSIQRRHQKILEESPSPRVDAGLRDAMGDAALRLARELGYRSAGTVEFLLDDATGEFFFLEVNTRLQVEHPVTELVTGIDLVREQLRIAAGEPLGYAQDDVTFRGAAIEARLYAEDPTNDFLPATGTLSAFAPAPTPEVRWDSGVAPGSIVGTGFDPMLAKVIAHAPTRREAAGRLALALARTHLGGVVTNRDFLVHTLRTPEFRAGDTTTDFIDRVKPARSLALGEANRTRLAQVAALWVQGRKRADAQVLGSAPSGWRNARLPDQKLVLEHGEASVSVGYRSLRDGRFRFADGATARVHAWHEDGIDVEIAGRRLRARVTRAGDQLVVHGPDGDVTFTERPRFKLPGSDAAEGGFVAGMPGKVLELRVKAGDAVRAGDTLVVLEAMKMEHPMRASEDGVVTEVHVTEGEQVEAGALLLVVEPASPKSRDAGE